jgi:methylglutaconyl-CoA hydratase
MSDVPILKTGANGVALLTLNRPEKHNALDADLIGRLHRAAEQLAGDDSVRVVVLAGQGESFCAGGDLGWMNAQIEADSASRAANAHAIAAMLAALDALPMPLIGRVQGPAFGGGLGLISVCDFAIGVETARFGLTETRLGLIPATIGPYVHARIGTAAARRVMVSPRLFDAAEAMALGFLAKVVAPAALDKAIEAEVSAFLGAAPGAVRSAKKLVRDLGGAIPQEVTSASISALVDRWESPEALEGIAAFFGRRKPGWDAS